MTAPLCRRCAGMLHGPFFDVYLIGAIAEGETECPWCQKARPDAVYRLQIKQKPPKE